jgi:hypothetical protein
VEKGRSVAGKGIFIMMYVKTISTIFSENLVEETERIVANLESKYADDLFCQAVQENWNYESEWLWLARRVALPAQRRYCYEKALYINPGSKAAKKGLKSLPKTAR